MGASKPGGSARLHWANVKEKAKRELDALDPVKVRKLEDLLEQEFRQMVFNAENAGFDVDEQALEVWKTASVYLKHYLVPAAHRNALQKPYVFKHFWSPGAGCINYRNPMSFYIFASLRVDTRGLVNM